MSDYEEKFGSLARVYGEAALEQIRNSHICIVGLGGVGSWAAEALARCGVEKLTLVDGDTISRSNINRQVHALESSIGKLKTEVMRQRLLDINEECNVHTIDQFIDDTNLREVLEQDYDVILDAIDIIKYKAAIIYCSKRNKIPILTTGGAGGLKDPCKIQINDLTTTWNDPLAAAVRSRLRHKYGYTRDKNMSFGVPCVYSTEQHMYPDKDGNPGYKKPGVDGLSLDCAFGYGSSVMVTASFGFTAASKIISMRCGG